jgi:HK97 family phage portal protein
VSFIESLSRGALGLRADVSGTPAPWDDYWYNPLGSASASGMRVTEASAKRDATVLACVGVIGRNLGMMPCRIYTEAPDGSKKAVNHHPLYDVLYSRPNSQQTAFEFKQMMQGHLELRGNAYAEIIPGPRGPVDQLVPMHPDRVHVERVKPTGRLRYVYNDPNTDKTRVLLQEEVFHLRNFSDNGWVGQSTIAMATDLIGLALAQQDYSARFLKNDARPPFVFEGTNFKTKEDEARFREKWQAGQTGVNRGKAGLLPPGITIKELGVKPIDQQLIDAEKFSRIKICSIFGVPPHLIGETEKTATYASVEQFNIMYATHCILPRLVLWEQAIQRDLLTSTKYFAKFSMAALLRGDTASRFTAYVQAITNGWMSQDDVRMLEDLNPLPNGIGRRYWRPSNWTALDTPDAPRALPVVQQPEETDTENEQDDQSAGDGEQAKGGEPIKLADGSILPPEVTQERLKVLAASAADRCVRKEVAALRKLVERAANDYQLEEFYEAHAVFVADVLRLDSAAMVPARQVYYDRASRLTEYLDAGEKAEAYDFIDRLAAKESIRLAGLAVGGVN